MVSEESRLTGIVLHGMSGGQRSRAAMVLETLLQPAGLVPCVIHDTYSHTGAYVVRTPGGRTRMAAKLSETGITPLGARDVGHFQVGDGVLCIFPQGMGYGYIVGAMPPQVFDARFVLPDSLVMRSRAGYIEDLMHHSAYENEKNGLANFSAGRPADAVQGDWGRINELGVAIWMGKLLAQLRASDAAKVEVFWGDDLLRLVGYNLHRCTAGSEFLACDDGGEYDEVELWTPFMWEALGAYEPGIAVFTENPGESGALRKGSEKSRYEPKEAAQVIVPRGIRMRGYLGDIEHRRVVLPPAGATGVAVPDDGKDYRGVFSEHVGMDGSYHLRSAKEIILEKSLIMPVPRRLLDPDAPDGDSGVGTDPDYKPAGYYGSGPDQEKKPYEWDEGSPLARPTEFWEYHAYLFGRYGLQVVDAHEKDWTAPEERDLEIAEGVPNELDDAPCSGLGFDFSAPLPKYGAVAVDQRTGHSVRYYRTRAGLFILDDGSVVIEDGYGSRITMSGGNIQMSCQGDIFGRPGRSFIVWAPRDVINRAGYCAEMSAAKKDVRIKAENSLHLRAGSGATGSILLECNASGRPARSAWSGKIGEEVTDTGIILKADKAAIALLTKQLFGGMAGDEAGNIELNAGSGQAVLAGNRVGLEALQEMSVMVGADRSRTTQPPQLIINAGRALLRSALDVVGDLGLWPGSKGAGDLKIGGKLEVKSNIRTEGLCVANRHFQSKRGGDVADKADYRFEPDPPGEGSKQETEADTVKQRIFGAFDRDALDQPETSLGNRALWSAVGFSFRRSKEHYKVNDRFQVYETRWQQLYRAHGGTAKWDEPEVTAPDGTQTCPHPGHAAWKDEKHYNYVGDGRNVDYKKGTAKPRADQTESPDNLEEATLADAYLINVQS